MDRRIVCAAARNKRGDIICSPRHFDATYHAQVGITLSDGWKSAEQGFVDQKGIFWTREEAWEIAEHAGQILRRVGGDTINGGKLFSENLY